LNCTTWQRYKNTFNCLGTFFREKIF
jgi:hypothetical protein